MRESQTGISGSTVWRGSDFSCISQDISLFHADYESTGAYGECGDILGQSVRSDVDVNTTNNSTTVSHYISRLTVPIKSGTVGRTIECYYDDGATTILIERETVNITIGIVNTMDNNNNKKHYCMFLYSSLCATRDIVYEQC